jgi:hypothetical protein
VRQDRKHRASDVVDTIRRRMERSEGLATVVDETARLSDPQSVPTSPSSISHARFSALSSRLAQVSAKASADSLTRPACAHDPIQMETVLRFLTDVRRIADVITAFATGDCPVSASDL